MADFPFYAPDFSVSISGLTMAADVRQAVRSVSVDSSLDEASMFTLEINNAGLQFTDSPLFDVGKEVEIHMGYAGELEPMILGEITAISPSFPESGAPMLAVTGYDKSHRMRHNSPPERTFKNMNDSLIAAQIAAENLLIPVVDPAPMPRESVTQSGSDWSLLSELALRNYFRVYVHWDKLFFRFPRPQTERVTLEWGRNLSSFSPRLSNSGQVGIEVVRGYDPDLEQAIVAVLPLIAISSDLDEIIERVGSGVVNQLAQLGRHVVRDQPVTNYFEAATLAKTLLQQVLDGLYEGSGQCIGLPALRAGEIVEVRGVGRRFSGNYTLSRVTHTIDDGGYRTSFEATQRWTGSLLQSLRQKITDEPPPGRRPPQEGVRVATVRQNVDPKGMGRVQLNYPGQSDSETSRWARVATFMAGGDKLGSESWGGYFLPDIGDEVLVAFENSDVDRPVVIGSLWTGLRKPPERNDGRNAERGIWTKTGMQVLFDETTGAEKLLIRDKAGNTLTLDSTLKKEQVALKDVAGDGIEMSAIANQESIVVRMGSAGGEVRIEHAKGSSIVLKNDGSVSIVSKGNLELKAQGGDITLDAANVKVTVTGTMDVS